MFEKYRLHILIGSVAVAVIATVAIVWQMAVTPEVFIHGVAIEGMSQEEIDAALVERFQTQLEARVVRYTVGGETALEFTFADFGARFDFSELIHAALNHGLVFGRTYNITTMPMLLTSAENTEVVLQKISQTVDVPAQNASFYEENGVIAVKPEVIGFAANIEAAARDTAEVLASLSHGTVELEIIEALPLHTSAELQFSPTVLGVYSTVCHAQGDEPRIRNIARAVEKMNNTTLFPGEVFSAGEVIAANVPDSGYEKAVVLVRGVAAEDIGGGVCQVVTTLYNAALLAELEIIQRHNHSARVSYVDLGFDATVAGDYYDLKFKNNTSHAIVITSRVENDSIIIKIHGHDTRDPARSVRFEARQVEMFPPGPYREVVDAAIPLGERLITMPSQMGYHVELFKHIYMNGEEVEQIKVNTSIYKPLQGVIAIGAG